MKKILLALLTTLALSTPSLAKEVKPVPQGKAFPPEATFSFACSSEGSARVFVDTLPASIQLILNGAFPGCAMFGGDIPVTELVLEYAYTSPEGFADAIIASWTTPSGTVWVPLNSAAMVPDETF